MKKFRFIAVLLASVLLLTTFVSAAAAFSSDDFKALGEYFGTSDEKSKSDTDDPDAVKKSGRTEVKAGASLTDILQGLLGSAADGLTNSQLNDILSQFDITKIIGGDSEVLNEILDYIAAFTDPAAENPTKKQTEPSSKEEQQSVIVTEAPSTEPPTQQVPVYTYVYITEAPQTYVYIPQTQPAVIQTIPESTTEETTVVEYVPPEQVFTDILTTGVYSEYAIEEEEPEDHGSTLKLVAGLVIIVISLVAVVGVSIALKKSRI